jgi:phenylpyruvate tautomerase PptA (4-oxalocrotonate tautomerase family)
MPILFIEFVHGPGELPPENAAQVIADLAGEILDTSPGQTWVRLRLLDKGCYAENGMSLADTPTPVFVSVLKKSLESREQLAIEAASLARGIGEVLNRPTENVHIAFEPPGAGRIAFGGDLSTS